MKHGKLQKWPPHFSTAPPRSCALHFAIAADREIALIAVTGVATVAGITCQLQPAPWVRDFYYLYYLVQVWLVNIGYDHPTIMMICHEIHSNGHMIIWITTCAGMTIPQYGTWVGCGSFCFIKSDETTLKKSNLLFWAGWQSGLPRNSIVLKIRQFAHSKHLLYSLRWYLPAAIQKKTNIGTAGSGCPIWLHNIKEMWETKV